MTVPTYTPDSTETVDRPDSLPIAVPDEDAGCPACAHALSDHDPIGARFCRATVAGGLSRGCVCRS
jgi:hypothetical protein